MVRVWLVIALLVILAVTLASAAYLLWYFWGERRALADMARRAMGHKEQK